MWRELYRGSILLVTILALKRKMIEGQLTSLGIMAGIMEKQSGSNSSKNYWHFGKCN
jgi:hypothetical protein